MKRQNFLEEITQVINRYSEENKSNTPDFILAQYMKDCLDVLNKTIKMRDDWYGRTITPSDGTDQFVFPKEAIPCDHPKEYVVEKVELDCFPYGDNITTRFCTKCGESIDFKAANN